MKISTLTKRQALDIYKKPGLLANALGITVGAVSQWPVDKPIPEAAYLKIRYILKPELFSGDAVVTANTEPQEIE